MQKYHIKLTDDERQKLKKYLYSKKYSMESKTHAKILLNLDEKENTKLATMKIIAAHCGVSEVTLWNIRKKFVEQGLAAVLNRKKRDSPPRQPKITGKVEAHIIAVCCSTPPKGQSRWTLKMIVDKIVLDGVIDSISDETVRRVLKKRNLSHI
jgi:transposase